MNHRELDPTIGIIISILLMATTILIGNLVVLQIKPQPFLKALIIAAVSNLLGKLFVSFLHLPAAVSYALPTLAFFLLSTYFFKPTPTKLLLYWIVGFAAYLFFHVVLSSVFGWTFMFPFWNVRLFS
ncbi:MAG: hypothetical protein MUE68_04200 [Bacteroidetes bacterium]|jgi:hypothetical protein|nr:hypothetical protein [Bacteroidota bacterium]